MTGNTKDAKDTMAFVIFVPRAAGSLTLEP
jgi:hypothetical protein